MAKGKGIFSKVTGFLKKLVTRENAPPAQPPPPPPRPPPPSLPSPPEAGGGGFTASTLEARQQETYRDITGTYTGYLDWHDLFSDLQVDFDDDNEREYFWDLFMRSFYLDSHDPGHVSRGGPNNPGRFFQETGIPFRALDWSEWRDLMGYSSRK